MRKDEDIDITSYELYKIECSGPEFDSSFSFIVEILQVTYTLSQNAELPGGMQTGATKWLSR